MRVALRYAAGLVMPKKLVLPPTPSLDDVPAPIAKAFAKILQKHTTTDAMQKNAAALGKLLAKNKVATAKLHAALGELARALGPFEPLTEIKNKPTRITAFERLAQIEMMASSLRSADAANDTHLVELVLALPDNSIRGTIVNVLRGGQIELTPSRDMRLSTLLDSRNVYALRAALGVMFETDPKTIRNKWKSLLEAPTNPKLVELVFDEIERKEMDHTKWLALVAPLTLHADRGIALAAGSLITKQPAMFRAYVAWAREHRDPKAVIGVISQQLYWASLRDRSLGASLVEPLRALRDRARDKASTDALDRALKKINVSLGGATAKKRTLPAPIAQVGTDGGPPLVVPTEHLAAWLGTEGPDPFDSGGNNDYERACDAKKPLIRIGKGHGVVLAEQSCDVYEEDTGLLFIASGELDEEVEDAWKSIGNLTVGKQGIVVLDAAEVGASKGSNRARLALAAGRYDVRVHDPAGFGGDFTATRLARQS